MAAERPAGTSNHNSARSAGGAAPFPLSVLSLADLPVRVNAWVDTLTLDGDAEQQSLLIRLVEIGFLPGQAVRVVARAAGGGDPIAVRVGRSTFALRRGEAALVQVRRTESAADSADLNNARGARAL